MLGPLEPLLKALVAAVNRNAEELAKLREAIVAPGDVELHVKTGSKPNKKG